MSLVRAPLQPVAPEEEEDDDDRSTVDGASPRAPVELKEQKQRPNARAPKGEDAV